MLLTFSRLRSVNVTRMRKWHRGGEAWSGADWGNAMAGECGEACNVIKKIRRWETGLGDKSYNTPELEELMKMLADELADLVTYADLVAHHYGIDLGEAVRAKFNVVSIAQGMEERL